MHRSEFEVQSGGADLAVGVFGSSGRAVVALHPGVGDSRIWQWCAPVWADAGHRVVAYDRRGYGATRVIAEPFDDLLDLLAVTEATAARPAVIIGNSLGGGLALDLALAHPDHVTGLILIAPSPSGYDYSDWPESDAELQQDILVQQAEEAGDLALVNRLEVRYWLDGVDQPEGRVAGEPRDLLLAMNAIALQASPVGAAVERPPAWPILSQIDVPTLVVVGAYDLPGVRMQCSDLVRALPQASLVTIDGSAHCPSLDRPDELNSLILDFMADIV